MLSVFGDESHDSQTHRIFVVGGLLGDESQWKALRSTWKEKTRGLIFHAADCESGYGAFKNMTEDDRHRLHRQLTGLLADSGLFGRGTAIELAGCREAFPEVMGNMPDMPYYDCFLKTVVELCDLAAHFVPPDKVEFTFDQHRQTEYNAGLLYDWLCDHRPVAVEKISFATRKEIGVQVADLWARELMKRCDGMLFNPLTNPRPQWQTLSATHRFKGAFLSRSYWHSMRSQMSEAMSMAGFNNADYFAWLGKNRRIDNLSNRFLYVSSLHSGPIGLMKETPGDVVDL